jgi:hypothetical protein
MGIKILEGGYPLDECDVIAAYGVADDITATSVTITVAVGARSREPRPLGYSMTGMNHCSWRGDLSIDQYARH